MPAQDLRHDVRPPGRRLRVGPGRGYRREDSDKPGDRFRLYELAGVPHLATRQAPHNDVSLWKANFPDDDVTFGPKMNSLPHFEPFNMGLHHLVEWVANGSDESFDTAKLRELHRDSADYLQHFASRLDELIAEGRLLTEDAEDAEDLRSEARELEIP